MAETQEENTAPNIGDGQDVKPAADAVESSGKPTKEAGEKIEEPASKTIELDEKAVELTKNGAESGKVESAENEDIKDAKDDSPSDSRKRKHSPADRRDWRERRNSFQRERSGSREGRSGSHRGGRGGARGRGKGRGRGNDNRDRDGSRPYQKVDYSANVKSNYDDIPESDDPEEIRKQVEFYFSDSNLYMDKFLLGQVGGAENKPVPIKVIHNFKRMRHFQPYSAIVAALKESTILTITDDDEILRKTPLPDNVTAEDLDANLNIMEDHTRSRSIYAKGFGEEGPSTQFDIEAFFTPYGPYNAIRLRRAHPEKTFKGSVFVEFDSDETQKAFLDLETKPKWNGKELQIMSKEEYVKGKARDVRDGKIRGNEIRQNKRGGYESKNRGGGARGRGRGGGRGGARGGRDRDRRDYTDDRNRESKRRRSPDYGRGGDSKSEDVIKREEGGVAGKTDSTSEAVVKHEDGNVNTEKTDDAAGRKKRKADDVNGDAPKETDAKKAKVDDEA